MTYILLSVSKLGTKSHLFLTKLSISTPSPILFSSTPSAQIVSRIIKNHLLRDGGFGSGTTQQPFPRMKANLLEITIIQIAPNNSAFISKRWGKSFFPSPRHLEPPPTCPFGNLWGICFFGKRSSKLKL